MSEWLTTRRRRLIAFWERVGPRTRDVAAILFALLLVTAQAFTLSTNRPLLPHSLVPWVVLPLPLILWWRRSHPVLVTLLALAVEAVTGTFGVATLGLFTLAILRRDRVLVLLALLHMGLIFTDRQNFQDLWPPVLFWAFFTATVVAVGAYIGARRDLVTSLRDRADRAEAERELKAAQARVSERSRIAREMHDVLAHKVSLIALHAGGMEVNPGMSSDRVRESAELIRSTARQALEDLRGVLGVLRADASADGADLAPQPGLSEVPTLVAASRAAGVSIDARIEPVAVADPVGRAVYRVVQEALTNVHKHARGSATRIVVARVVGSAPSGAAAELVVRISNAAPVAAGSLLPGTGSGLVGLRERVELLDGTLTAGPDGGGWVVRASFPLPASAADAPPAPAGSDAAQRDSAEASDAASGRSAGNDVAHLTKGIA